MTTAEAVKPLPFIDGIVYGEGPRWHQGRLWFTDGPAGKVYSASETGELNVEAEVAKASGLGWLPDGTLMVSSLFASKIDRVDGDGNVVATDDFSELAWSTNDLIILPDGRAYVDLYHLTATGMTGDIALIKPGEAVRIVATGLAVPNGLGVLPDGSTLVVSETSGSRLLAFPMETDGSLGEPTVFADLGPGRHPDGLCVDIEGGVWVGCSVSQEFVRVLAGGTITHRTAVDHGWAIAPALGGADGRTLYMVVDDTTVEGVVKGESTGWIMQARVDVPGTGSP